MRLDLRAFVFPVLLVALAEAASLVFHSDSESLAAPHQIAMALGEALTDGSLLQATGETLGSSLAGLSIGMSIGLCLGLFLGMAAIADKLAEVTIECIRPIPSVALIPIGILVFGFGFRMEIAIVGFTTIWPVMIITRAAVVGVEPRLLEVATALRLSPLACIKAIVVPAVLPQIFIAFRLACGVALIVSVTIEIAANPIGLGEAIMGAQRSLRPALMLGILTWIGLIGLTLELLLGQAQARVWRYYGRVETEA